MSTCGSVLAVVSVLACCAGVQAETIIDTVAIGDPGNTPDDEVMWQDGTTGYGGVSYTYSIGKYEVTNGQYAEFLNSVAAVGDPLPLCRAEERPQARYLEATNLADHRCLHPPGHPCGAESTPSLYDRPFC